MVPSDLPGGVFSFFLDLWDIMRSTFFDLVSWFTENTVKLDNADISFLAVFIGSGLVIYIGVAVVKWIIGIIL